MVGRGGWIGLAACMARGQSFDLDEFQSQKNLSFGSEECNLFGDLVVPTKVLDQ